MSQTSVQFDQAIASCSDIFFKKTKDYGTAWRVLRIISVVDQIFIKALRIRTIQDLGNQKVEDDIHSEFKGILNYAVIGLIQLKLGNPKVEELPVNQVQDLYHEQVLFAKTTMLDKNHDYGEAWRDMRVSSLTDLILTKVLRIKQIEDNKGMTLVSEGIEGNYFDMLNYSVFALIHLDHKC